MKREKPLAIDLYCGLGGWSEALLAEGWRVVGFDIERHRYPKRILPESSSVKRPGESIKLGVSREPGNSRAGSFNYANECALRDAPLTGEWDEYPGQLVIQDVLTLHGSQFRDASLIVASPPCQEYSYMAMPWSLAKEKARKYESGELDVADLTRLFDACFRIQREAIKAAGHHIPLIVENVRGAQKWVGRAKWNFGSYYLWGDVPALMPITLSLRMKSPVSCAPRRFSDREPNSVTHNEGAGQKREGRNFLAYENGLGSSPSFNGASHETRGVKHEAHNPEAVGWFGTYKPGDDPMRNTPSKSNARKAASAQIAKIPFALAQHIAQSFKELGT